ncbi:MAG: hypothetical protein U1D30_19745 [Planctomycetota bacterium]
MLVLIAPLGCNGKKERPSVYPGSVKGQVFLDGKPLTQGTITFIPELPEEAGGRPGLARIEEDGSYWVGSANRTKPSGLIPGKYKVTVLTMKPNPGEGQPIATLAVPEKYTEIGTSPLEANIVEGENVLRFDLQSETSKSEKPAG